MLDMILLKNKAQAFAEKLLQEHNHMVYEFSNQVADKFINDLKEYIKLKYKITSSNIVNNDSIVFGIIADNEEILYTVARDNVNRSCFTSMNHGSLTCINNINVICFFKDIYCSLTRFNYNLLSNAENYKKIGIIYAILEVVISKLKSSNISNIYNIDFKIIKLTEDLYYHTYPKNNTHFMGRVTIDLSYKTLKRFTTL